MNKAFDSIRRLEKMGIPPPLLYLGVGSTCLCGLYILYRYSCRRSDRNCEACCKRSQPRSTHTKTRGSSRTSLVSTRLTSLLSPRSFPAHHEGDSHTHSHRSSGVSSAEARMIKNYAIMPLNTLHSAGRMSPGPPARTPLLSGSPLRPTAITELATFQHDRAYRLFRSGPPYIRSRGAWS